MLRVPGLRPFVHSTSPDYNRITVPVPISVDVRIGMLVLMRAVQTRDSIAVLEKD